MDFRISLSMSTTCFLGNLIGINSDRNQSFHDPTFRCFISHDCEVKSNVGGREQHGTYSLSMSAQAT